MTARDTIAAAFGAAPTNAFGSSEGLNGSAPPGDDVFTFASDMAYLEFVDDHDRHVPTGTPAHHVLVTNLVNTTQPLTRYRLDEAMTPQPALPGRGHQRATLQGRCDEVVRFGPHQLHPIVVRSVLAHHAAVDEYQVRTAPHSMHVAVVTTAPLDTTQLTGELTRALCGAGINGITITVTATVAAYNDWDVDRTMSLCADDCRFVGPATGEIDSAAFEANMRQMLAAYPDRRLRILASAVGDGCEFAEVELTGGPMNVSGAVVFAVVDDAVTSQRWYYAPPPGGFTTPSR